MATVDEGRPTLVAIDLDDLQGLMDLKRAATELFSVLADFTRGPNPEIEITSRSPYTQSLLMSALAEMGTAMTGEVYL